MGKPLQFETPAILQKHVNSYFDSRTDGQYCITELLYHIDISWECLSEYLVRPIYGDILKKAKMRIASAIERKAVWSNSAGAMFWLKCNLGWHETQRIEQEISYAEDVTAASGWAKTKERRLLNVVGSPST